MPPPLAAAAAHGVGYRAMTDDDLPFLAALYFSTREEELAVVPWPPEVKQAFLASQFEAQHSHYQGHYPDAEWLVVEIAGEAVGRLYIEEWPTQMRIIDIALVPAARGRGIGRAIIEDVIALAAGRGKAVSIHVEKNNPARRLYDRLGFKAREDKGVYDLLVRG